MDQFRRRLGAFRRAYARKLLTLSFPFSCKPRPGRLSRFQDTLKQLYFVGNYSLVIILVSGLFVGFVLGLQGDYVLSSYGSEQALGVLVALSLLRELGPVVTALLFAGRAGTSLTAEIGLMNAGEQLSALEMMGVDPIRRILGPRFWPASSRCRCLRSCSPLSALSAAGRGCSVDRIGFRRFWAQMQAGVEVGPDIGNGIIKTFVFGVASERLRFTKAIQLVQRRKVFRARLRRTVVVHLLLF